MRIGRTAQSAGKAGTMIILIAVVLLLYLLFLPPQTRDALLFEDDIPGSNGDSIPSSQDVEERLLLEEVGRLEYAENERDRYNIPAYTVTTSYEGTELQNEDGITVTRSVFENNQATIAFPTSPSLTEDVVLSFNVEESRGELTVLLNGETLYNREIQPGNAPPIRINRERLEGQNTLTFLVDSPGIAFWRTNFYELENVKVTARVKDTSQNTNRQNLYIPQRSYDQLERAKVTYLATCQEAEVEGFQLSLNRFELFEGIPDCSIVTQKEINPAALQPGDNTVETRVTEGTVLMDRFTLTAYYEDTETRTYYFDMDDDLFIETENGSELRDEYNVIKTIRFTDTSRKEFRVFTNARVQSYNTREPFVNASVRNFVVPGQNSVEIEPLNDLTISTITYDLVRNG